MQIDRLLSTSKASAETRSNNSGRYTKGRYNNRFDCLEVFGPDQTRVVGTCFCSENLGNGQQPIDLRQFQSLLICNDVQ